MPFVLALMLAQAGTFAQFDYPGAILTSAMAINDRGTVVGYYQDASYQVHGFLLSNGTPQTIDGPNALYTLVRGINDAGDVVGEYIDDTGVHAFRWNAGTFTLLDVGALAINDNGDFVGFNGSQGYLVKAGVVTPIVFAGADVTMPTGLNLAGDVVGSYLNFAAGGSVHSHGFFFHEGTFTTLDGPGALDGGANFASGINDAGVITGTVQTQDYVSHGYIYSHGEFTLFEVPGSYSTYAYGINSSNQIVGWFNSSAFVYSPRCTSSPTVATHAISLWPPNARFQTVHLVDCATVTASCDGPFELTQGARITAVSSSEGSGVGPTVDSGTGVQLEAARAGFGPGRIYTIDFTVTDSVGNQSTAQCEVSAPHDRRKSP